MLRLLISIVSLIASISVANAFSWNTDKEKLALDLARRFQAAHRVPSIAASVTLNGRTVIAKGLDGAGPPAPGVEDARYHIGSVTKQFTAAAILAMIEDKVIVPSTGKPLTLDTKGLERALASKQGVDARDKPGHDGGAKPQSPQTVSCQLRSCMRNGVDRIRLPVA